jgi:hypothetical protein
LHKRVWPVHLLPQIKSNTLRGRVDVACLTE